jgi:DegV family protein with EDD domain
MSKVAIITDSTVNLPQSLLDEYSISVLPQTLIWENETLRDGIDIQPKEFYTRLKSSKSMPTTAQITPNNFSQLFSSCLEKDQDVLAILVSSKLSGTMASAVQAKTTLPGANIEVVDSLSCSLAMGFHVLMAARAAANGANLKECKALAEKAIQHTGVFFVVNTLEFLHRGGRIGGGARFLGTALNLKPILELRDGRIEAMERVWTQNKAFSRLIALIGERVKTHHPIRLGVLEANAPEEAQMIMEQVQNNFHPDELIHGDISPVVGTHTGPGTIGIAYMTDM